MAAGDRNVTSSQSDDRISVVCYHCDKPQDVSRKAQSLTCKFCYKSLKLQDVYWEWGPGAAGRSRKRAA